MPNKPKHMCMSEHQSAGQNHKKSLENMVKLKYLGMKLRAD